MASLRSIATVSGFTAMSRVLGVIRDVLIARFFGTGIGAEAFLAAFRLPNLGRRVFGEGAFNAAFVPLFGRQLEECGKQEAENFANHTLSLMAIVLGTGTIVAIPLMRWIMAIFTPGFLIPDVEGWSFSWEWFWAMARFPEGTERFELTVSLGRITFSYLLCLAMAAHLSGVLNTLRIFAMPAFAPVLLNIIFLIGLSIVIPVVGASAYVLAWCVCIAGFVQFGALLINCRAKGLRIRFVRPRLSPEMRRLFKLMGPGIVSASVQQINLLIGTQIASLQTGAVALLYFADRINQFPLGMIGIAFGVVLLPDITRKLRSNQVEAARASLLRGVENAMLITLPAAVALMVLPIPIIRTFFEYGKFDVNSSVQTAYALAGFAAGLPAYVLVRVLQPGYYARENTRSPMVMAVITVGVNIAFSLALFPAFGHVGIAVATSIAGWVNVLLLGLGLRRDRFLRMPGATRVKLGKAIAASVVMGAGVFALYRVIGDWFDGGMEQRVGGLTLLVGAGMGLYAILVLGLRATSLREFKADFHS
ncbi:MAG: murein biosynthesis integral membrane protein MurJ [Verrucomicrobiales bacterium]